MLLLKIPSNTNYPFEVELSDSYSKLRLNVEAVAKRFNFQDFNMLRLILKASGAIISGSAALSVLHDNSFEPDDIDFYVLPKGFPILMTYLTETGYRLSTAVPDPSEDYPDYGNFIAGMVLTLYHTLDMKKVNVIVSSDDHLVSTVACFHSTIVMNYIAWFGVVSMYNSWTLRAMGLKVSQGEKATACFGKYETRGFTLTEVPPVDADHVCATAHNCLNPRRYLDDEDCKIYPFDNLPAQATRFQTNVTWKLPFACKASSL